MTDIEKNIKDIIEEVSDSKYVGKLAVNKEDIPNDKPLWMLLLYLDLEQSPMVWAYQGSEEDFLEYVRSEVRSRKLHAVHFWKGVQNLPDLENICNSDE